ncbi:sulfur carrier protein ThiS [Actinocrinis sp.]|uniref:sulfur carrier protein ThiS n=1 Tax=Actinocrinis sp. TaxID=1920516 RepID=UPI002D2CD966|nr:sulfur carrier protein ThiS [Actinocrinis sp.]HZP50856.1 sulfur carrier protein ThiS [Actinocrinis sp.]
MTTTPIRVVVNGQPESYPADTTLGAVVSRLRPSRMGIAVAVGDDVVPRAEWDVRQLRDGDEIEILTAVQGG